MLCGRVEPVPEAGETGIIVQCRQGLKTMKGSFIT